MSENTNGKASTFSIISLLSAAAVIFGLTTGLFDRGTSNGAFNEKILNVEKSMTRIERQIDSLVPKVQNHEFKSAVVEQNIEQLRAEVRRLEQAISDVRDQIYRSPR